MKNIVSILVLFVSIVCMASPVNSMLGSNGCEVNAGGWENPYISDGLVAMWDGEWNVGFGIHDSASTEWIDLISGNAIQIINEQLTFEEDSLRFSSGGGIFTIKNNIIPIISDSHTIEVVSRVVEMPTAPGGNSYITVFNGALPIRMPKISTSGDVSLYYSGIGDFRLGMNAIGEDLNLHLSLVSDVNNAKSYIYKSGELYNYVNNSKRITSQGLELFSGVFGTGWSAGTVLEICSIRVYSRALGNEEVYLNYLVDKERFGL